MRVALVLPLLAALAVSCAGATLKLPTGSGEPLPRFDSVFAEATANCRDVRTMTAEIGLAGRVGRGRLRGRAIVGLAKPGSLRLEAVAPFGGPVFILVATPEGATLLLPREDRVVNDRHASALLKTLTGVAMEPGDLLALLSGCVVANPVPIGGRSYGSKWMVVDLEGGATAFLQSSSGSARVVAIRREDLTAEYGPFDTPVSRKIHVRVDEAASTDGGADLVATLSQVETNVSIDPAAFTVRVPDTATSITLDELRDSVWTRK